MAQYPELHGSCACERNQYTIVIPSNSSGQAHVFFDNSAANRRSQATPLSAWLRVPLDWYHSATTAYFPDETHSTIRRTFHSPSQHTSHPPTRRQFCGFCGTHLTAWNEDGGQGADYMNITLGSLLSESLERLESLGLLDGEEDEEVQEAEHQQQQQVEGSQAIWTAPGHRLQFRGLPYFEDMVQDSRLARIRRQKGGHISDDGRTTVRWEVVEIGDGDEETGEDVGNGKRRRMEA